MTDVFKGSFVSQLTPKDFDPNHAYKLKNHKCSLVMFYTNWCPHCQNAKPIIKELAETAPFFDVCAMDCEKYSDHLQKISEIKPNHVRGYPTIWVYENGEPLSEYGDVPELGKLVKLCMNSCASAPEK